MKKFFGSFFKKEQTSFLDNPPAPAPSHRQTTKRGSSLSDYRRVIADKLLSLLHPTHILLATGRDSGSLAALLAEAAQEATLHIAGRHLPESLRALRQSAGDRCVLHHAAIVDVIGILPVPGLCWIDADPNWHATQAILQALAAQAASLGKEFPVTIVANAGWPYGRRDGYDDPAGVPAPFCHPHERAGLLPGQAAPAGAAGLHGDRFNGSVENEPGHGVLTAIEDFLDGRTGTLRLATLPGFGGLAVLAPRTGPGAAVLSADTMAGIAAAMAEGLEAERLRLELALHEARDAVRRAESLAATLQAAVPAVKLPPGSLRAVRKMARLARRVVAGPAAAPASPAEEEADAACLRASPIFDAAWYYETYPDVAGSGVDAALHYLRHGAAELRDPGPHFSSADYWAENEDVAAAGLNPLLHYLRSGAAEGRKTGGDFDPESYLAAHPALAGINPLEHFISEARAEGRRPGAP
jgi:hypothetical protein